MDLGESRMTRESPLPRAPPGNRTIRRPAPAEDPAPSPAPGKGLFLLLEERRQDADGGDDEIEDDLGSARVELKTGDGAVSGQAEDAGGGIDDAHHGADDFSRLFGLLEAGGAEQDARDHVEDVAVRRLGCQDFAGAREELAGCAEQGLEDG